MYLKCAELSHRSINANQRNQISSSAHPNSPFSFITFFPTLLYRLPIVLCNLLKNDFRISHRTLFIVSGLSNGTEENIIQAMWYAYTCVQKIRAFFPILPIFLYTNLSKCCRHVSTCSTFYSIHSRVNIFMN